MSKPAAPPKLDLVTVCQRVGIYPASLTSRSTPGQTTEQLIASNLLWILLSARGPDKRETPEFRDALESLVVDAFALGADPNAVHYQGMDFQGIPLVVGRYDPALYLRLVRVFLQAGADPNRVGLHQGLGSHVGTNALTQLISRTTRTAAPQREKMVGQLLDLLVEFGFDLALAAPALACLDTSGLLARSLDAGADLDVALGEAVFSNRLENVQLLLQRGADPNARIGGFLVHRRVREPAVLDALLDAGADIHRPGMTGGIHWLYAKSPPSSLEPHRSSLAELASWLTPLDRLNAPERRSVRHGADNDQRPFDIIVQTARGLDLNPNRADNPLSVVGNQALSVGRRPGETKAFETKDVDAQNEYLREVARALRAEGADVLTPRGLVMAAQLGDVELTREILEAGVPADGVVEHEHTRRTTALVQAVRGGRLEVIAMLLRHGANPDPSEYQWFERKLFCVIPPLMEARGLQTHQLLVEAGADVHRVVRAKCLMQWWLGHASDLLRDAPADGNWDQDYVALGLRLLELGFEAPNLERDLRALDHQTFKPKVIARLLSPTRGKTRKRPVPGVLAPFAEAAAG